MRCTSNDIERVTDLLMQAAESAYPDMEKERKVVRAHVLLFLSDQSSWVGTNGDAVLMAASQMLPFSRKKMAVVHVLCGRGSIKLLREFLNWVRFRPALKLVSFAPMFDVSDRVMSRFGFQRTGGRFELRA